MFYYVALSTIMMETLAILGGFKNSHPCIAKMCVGSSFRGSFFISGRARGTTADTALFGRADVPLSFTTNFVPETWAAEDQIVALVITWV